MSTPPSLPLLLTLLAACSAGGKDAPLDTGLGSTEVSGVIFKGPMAAGSVVSLQPMDEGGAAAGDPVEGSVSADDGSYAAALERRGLVLVSATGLALDESRGEDGPEALTLSGYAVLDEEIESLHVNVLTELSRARVEALLAEGLAPAEAIARAEEELVLALPVGGEDGPGAAGAALDPYGEAFAQSWLFAVSAVLAQAGREKEDAGEGSLGELMADLRLDLADDGALGEEGRAALYGAEERLDPDLASLALASLLDGSGRPPPNLHPALDSDHDGVRNDEDNCRYVANADQRATLGYPFGDACDDRLRAIASDDAWGCGVRVEDGALVCWEVDGAPSGGTPPGPDVFPAHQRFPWAEGAGLDEAYDDVVVADGLICALRAGASVDCHVEATGELLSFEGDYARIAASSELICAVDGAGALGCWDLGGARVLEDAGPYDAVDLLGAAGVCARSSDGELSWVEHPGAPEDLPSLPEGVVTAFDASEAGFGCAVLSDGSLSCFGEGALVEGAPSGSYADVVVGAGVACAADALGNYRCWRDEDTCPAVEEDGPGALWSMSAGGCQVCGLDEAGMGHCWPRLWDQDHP